MLKGVDGGKTAAALGRMGNGMHSLKLAGVELCDSEVLPSVTSRVEKFEMLLDTLIAPKESRRETKRGSIFGLSHRNSMTPQKSEPPPHPPSPSPSRL